MSSMLLRHGDRLRRRERSVPTASGARRTALSVALLSLFLASVLSGCAEPTTDSARATPTAAFEALRAALTADDGERAFQLHDADCRAYHLQRIRTIRARLASGESAELVLGAADKPVDVFVEGTPEESAGRIILAQSEIADAWKWLRDATVIDETLEPLADGQDRATVRLRRADGTETEIYFLEEPEGWSYDQFRLRQERMKRQ